MWMRSTTTPLPATTRLSVVSLCGQALSDAARASVAIRVVLPRVLLKEAFAALSSAKRTATLPTGDLPEQTELALRITLGAYAPVIAFPNTLSQMSLVLALNETIEAAQKLPSWLGAFLVSDGFLPAPLNFFTGQAHEIGAMSSVVRADLAPRLLGDCVWASARVGRLSAPIQARTGAFGGCSGGVQDVCDAGQRAFLTNALIDAGLAELQQRCVSAAVPTGVRSCSQSASFTSVAGTAVALPRALTSIVEVLDTWEPSMDRRVMLVNIGNSHWVSASVSFLSRSVSLYESMGGPPPTMCLLISRLLLFARQADLRRRAVTPEEDGAEVDWTVANEVNQPQQQDAYNCGLFAFAHVWCTAWT